MKRLQAVVLLLTSFLYSSLTYATPTEGEQYSILDNPYSSAHQIDKFFSLNCTPCWQMTELLKKEEESGELALHRTHVIFNESTQQAASLYYTVLVQKPNLSHELLNDLFSLVQTNNPLQQADIDAFFEKNNLVATQDMTETQKKQWALFMKDAAAKTEQTEISSIPSFVVNGRYMVKLRGHRSMEELVETMHYLESL